MTERSELLRCLAGLFAMLAVGAIALGAAVEPAGSTSSGAAIGPLLFATLPVA